MKKIFLALIVLVFVSSLCFAQQPKAPVSQTAQKDMTDQDFVAEAKENITEVSIADAKAMLDKKEATFLDVREPDEYKDGHIPEAINLPRGLLEFKINEKIPDKSTKIIVYCKTGLRSALAAYTLSRMGYKNVVNLKGGWEAWKLETQKSQAVQDIWDFGQVQEGQVLKHNFTLTNKSQKTLNITGTDTSCGCTASKVAKNTILPGESTNLGVEFNTKGYSGSVEKSIYVHTDNPDNSLLTFKIKAKVVQQRLLKRY